MAFRYEEAREDGFEHVRKYLISPLLTPAERNRATEVLERLVADFGPVVAGYPTWHPLVANSDPRSPITTPCAELGYDGLDHTVFFAHAFVSCPYVDGEAILRSVESLPKHECADVTAERMDVTFYNSGTAAILVKCDWHENLEQQNFVPKRVAVPLMIKEEMRGWAGSVFAERWETMSPYLLGRPHGARSSLFVSQDTAMAMKRAYMALVESGMFGPLRMD